MLRMARVRIDLIRIDLIRIDLACCAFDGIRLALLPFLCLPCGLRTRNLRQPRIEPRDGVVELAGDALLARRVVARRGARNLLDLARDRIEPLMDIGDVAGRLALLLALGIVGFAAAGCVFSAALLRARGRDALLATLLYPIIVPIVIAGARGTAQLIDPVAPDFDGARFWTQFLVAVDVLFVTAGVWAFEPIAAGD